MLKLFTVKLQLHGLCWCHLKPTLLPPPQESYQVTLLIVCHKCVTSKELTATPSKWLNHNHKLLHYLEYSISSHSL
jgi:hypothetical protein